MVAARAQTVWPRALARWSRFVSLRPPQICAEGPAVAWIDLRARQIGLHGPRIEAEGLQGCVEALLAHEVGHHVRWPGSLVVEARLQLLQRPLLPFPGYSLTNLFTDLLINEQLGRDEDLRAQLITIYRASTQAEAFGEADAWGADPPFCFLLLVFEELWQLAPGTLLGTATEGFTATFAGCRADAQMFAMNLFAMGPEIYSRFLYFVSVFMRYLTVREGVKLSSACGCQADGPSPEDWATALDPLPAERAAIERAIAAGWFNAKAGEHLRKNAGFDARIAGLPGFGTADASLVPEIMAAWYRREAERYLFRPPPQRRLGEPIVPTNLDDWVPGEPVQTIDWPSTFGRRGPRLGAALPLRRTRVAEDEGSEVPLWRARTEIYLDVSGSMPDPRFAKNAMTLAAQILVAATTRAGGRVRALTYSNAPTLFWTWTRSAMEISRFLMHYIGGGTRFPFGVLAESVEACGADQPFRVIITDRDFDRNHQSAAAHAQGFAEAAQRSARLVLLQLNPAPEPAATYRQAGAHLLAVADMSDFPRVATGLAHALFPEGSDVRAI